MEKKYFIEKIGNVSVRKRKGSKSLSLKISAEGKVRVTIPWYVSFDYALKFAMSKEEWIRATKRKIKDRAPAPKVFSPDNLPRLRLFTIVLDRTDNPRSSYRIGEGMCRIKIYREADLHSDEIQNFIKEAIVETLRREAYLILIERCSRLAAENGFKIRNIRIKNMKSRWGSCSTSGDINLTLHLVRLPDHLIDYILLHELVHTIHHNHSSDFYLELGNYVENQDAKRKELKEWSWVLRDLRPVSR